MPSYGLFVTNLAALFWIFCKVPKVTKVGNKELLWDIAFILPNKVNHNRPDLVMWNNETKECKIIDFSVPIDQNTSMKETEKLLIMCHSYVNCNSYTGDDMHMKSCQL